MGKPILAVVHIYYPEMWNELKSCLDNITLPYDLYVTTVEQNRNLLDDVKNFKADAKFEVVENRGYDVGPFIHVINQVNLDEYRYVIKLHTKRDVLREPYFRGMKNDIWRKNLLYFLQSKDIFNQYIAAFQNNNKIGMQAYHQLIVHNDIYDKKATNALKDWLHNNNYKKIKYAFVAGTMFITKAYVFKNIQRLNLSLDDFSLPNKEHGGQLAHVFERLLGYFVYQNNLIITNGLISEKENKLYHNKIKYLHMLRYFRFFFQKKITKSGKLLIKICKIPFPFTLTHKENK